MEHEAGSGVSDVVHDPAVAAAVLAYEDASAALHTAAIETIRAVKAFRAAHPAPPGKWWRESRGAMVLDDLPVGCTRVDCCGFDCLALAVAWDDDGEGFCEEHRP